MDLSDLYSDAILDLVANAPAAPRLAAPDASAEKTSRTCGSRIVVDIAVREGVIVDYGHSLSACALGQASAAVVADQIRATPVAEFLALRAQMTAMLKDGGSPPDGRWDTLALLAAVRDYPARHSSTLLVFDAVAAALNKIEAQQSTTAVP